MCQTAVFFGGALARYGFGGSHPWGSDRIYAFWSKLQSENIDNIVVEEPELAGEQAALSFHDKEYVELVKAASTVGCRLTGATRRCSRESLRHRSMWSALLWQRSTWRWPAETGQVEK